MNCSVLQVCEQSGVLSAVYGCGVSCGQYLPECIVSQYQLFCVAGL